MEAKAKSRLRSQLRSNARIERQRTGKADPTAIAAAGGLCAVEEELDVEDTGRTNGLSERNCLEPEATSPQDESTKDKDDPVQVAQQLDELDIYVNELLKCLQFLFDK